MELLCLKIKMIYIDGLLFLHIRLIAFLVVYLCGSEEILQKIFYLHYDLYSRETSILPTLSYLS